MHYRAPVELEVFGEAYFSLKVTNCDNKLLVVRKNTRSLFFCTSKYLLSITYLLASQKQLNYINYLPNTAKPVPVNKGQPRSKTADGLY